MSGRAVRASGALRGMESGSGWGRCIPGRPGTGLLVFFWSRKLVRFSMVVRIGGVGDKGRSGRRCVGSERSMYLVVLLERRRGGVRRAGKEKDCQRRHLRWMIDVETINQNPNKTVFGQSNRMLKNNTCNQVP